MKIKSAKKAYPFFELFEKFIKESKTGRRLQPNGKRITVGTINNYLCVQKLLRKFCQEKGFELRVRSVKHLTQREMTVEKNYWMKFYKKFTDYLYNNCGYFDNYAGQNIKILRTFFGYLHLAQDSRPVPGCYYSKPI